MSIFLFYDLKSVQSYIFSIPRLKYIIGGSALIDLFDHEFAPLQATEGIERVFTGGGKGCFDCGDDARADALQNNLIAEAQRLGLDIGFGRAANLAQAIASTTSLFPSLPFPQAPGEVAALDGHPCAISGDWPVAEPSDIHAIPKLRLRDSGYPTRMHFERELLERLQLPDDLLDQPTTFFHNVNAEEIDPSAADPAQDRASGRAGAAALGSRNRWAVIYMDGNGMGTQFTAATKALSGNDLVEWSRDVSDALIDCCKHACRVGLNRVIGDWANSMEADEIEQCRVLDGDGPGRLVLPARPLLVGGDDIIVLCHAAHAFTFFSEAAEAFARRSRKYHRLWLATGGELSISAGILFCSTSLPLAMAVPYAEELLASAKRKGRTLRTDDRPSPACIDWETVTESVIDSHEARRARSVEFHDADLDTTIRLTDKPYRLEDLNVLRNLATERYGELPRSLTHKLREILASAFWDRRLAVETMAPQHPALAEDLAEAEEAPLPSSRWRVDDGARHTDVLDIIEIVEENLRLERPTITKGR